MDQHLYSGHPDETSLFDQFYPFLDDEEDIISEDYAYSDSDFLASAISSLSSFDGIVGGTSSEHEYEGRSSSEAANETVVVRNERKRKPFHVPRLLKTDIRRRYATMVANMLNCSEYSTFHSFFDQFASASMKVKLRGVAQFLVPKHVQYFQETINSGDIIFSGSDWVRFHFFAMHKMAFDQIFQVKSARIIGKKKSKRSAIVMDTEISFTQVFGATPYELVDALFGVGDSKKLETQSTAESAALGDANDPISTSSPSQISPSRSSSSVYLPSPKELEDIPDPTALFREVTGQQLPILSHPVPISFPSRMVIFLDENKYIETIVLGTEDVLNFRHHQFGTSAGFDVDGASIISDTSASDEDTCFFP